MNIKYTLLGLLLLILSIESVRAQNSFSPFNTDPLTGMQTRTMGLSFERASAKLLPNGQPLISPNIRIGQELEIELTEPKGLTEENGMVYFGTSIKIKQSQSNKILADLGDVYGATAQGFRPGYLKKLTAKVSIGSGTYTRAGTEIDIVVTFFDKKGDGQIEVILPNLLLSNSNGGVSRLSKEYAPGYQVTANFGDSINGWLKVQGKEIESLSLGSSQHLSFHTQSKFMPSEIEGLRVSSQWFSWKGEKVASSMASLRSNANLGNVFLDIPLPTDTLSYGLNLLSVQLHSPATGKTMGVESWLLLYGDSISEDSKKDVGIKFAQLGGSYRKAGQGTLSYMLLSEGLTFQNTSKENLYQQGSYLIKDGNTYQGIALLEQSILLDSAYFEAHLALGLAYKSQRDYSESLRHLNICIELQPDHYESLYQMGSLHNAKGRYQKALIVLNKAVRYNYEMDGNVYYERAFANRKLQFYEKAALDYEKYTALSPNDFNGHYYKGFTYIDMKSYDRALLSLKKAVQLDPDSYDALYEWGFALKKMEDYEGALDKFDRALPLAAGTVLYGKMLAYKGDCLIKLGRNTEACQAYQNAVVNDYKAGSHLLETYCK